MRRVDDGLRRGAPVTVLVDGETVVAYLGESVAAALLADGRRTLGHTVKARSPRGLFCGMGVCFECVVTIDQGTRVRACMTGVRDGMRISTGTTDVDPSR